MTTRRLTIAAALLLAAPGGATRAQEDVPGTTPATALPSPLRSVALQSVILPDTRAEEWPAIRARVAARWLATYGEGPAPLAPARARYEEVERYEKHGLRHVRYRYQVVDDYWSEAVLVLPAAGAATPAPAVLTIHGSNGRDGKYGGLAVTGNVNRAYAIELARRGYATLSPDQFGFGSTVAGTTQDSLFARFQARYPTWTVEAMQLLTLVRALDVLDALPQVRPGAYGAMGNSLGGWATVYLSALDARVQTAVASTGVSPYRTNVHRLMRQAAPVRPNVFRKVRADGLPPYEVHEILALAAPKAMLFLEPFNDCCNPDVLATMESVYAATHVYRLLGAQAKLSFLVHGDGHDTRNDVRDFAYGWFDRHLRGAERDPFR